MPLINPQPKYTYHDYLTWDDDERWEIIGGELYNMSPAPAFNHQVVAGNIHAFLKIALKGKKCIPVISPVDVILSETDVVQPDVLIVCDRTKISNKGIHGTPDVLFEVLSPTTTRKDRYTKKRQYEFFGVKEYFVIDIPAQLIERFVLQENGKFDEGTDYSTGDNVIIQTLDNMELPVNEILDIPLREDEPNASN